MRKINAKSFQGYRPAKRKYKDFEKNKSTNTPSTNAPSEKQQSSTYQANKKD